MHALLSPSGAKKWSNCPGSLGMEADEPDNTSQYADEGTAAHALASIVLSDDKAHPAGYVGRVFTIVNGVELQPGRDRPPKLKGHSEDIVREFTVDVDMAGYVNTYVQAVREQAINGDLFVEQRVPVGHITGEEGATGTSDAVIVKQFADGCELQVHDLKYGMGVRVSAEGNLQGVLYLLGALEQYTPIYGGINKFRFFIHQPRLGAISEWALSYDELMAYAEDLKAKAKVATIAYQHRNNWIRIAPDHSYLNPGAWCNDNFCKAKATCPALARKVQDDIGADFEVLKDAKPEEVTKLLPTELAPLGEKFKAIDAIEAWCKAVRAKAEAALFEHLNSVEAQEALGVKLVPGKKGSRAWESEEAAEAALRKMRLKVEEIFDMKVKSPTSIEKQLKDQPKRWEKLAPLITQKDGKPSVAPLSDKRPALVLKPVADDFEALPNPEDLV